MLVRYREFVFPPFHDAEPEVVGCVVEWGWNEARNRMELSYRFRTWLEPLANYLYHQMETLNLGLDTLEQGAGVYEGRGRWLEVKYQEGPSREALRRWFTDTYVHARPSAVPLYTTQPSEALTPVRALHERPDSYATPEPSREPNTVAETTVTKV